MNYIITIPDRRKQKQLCHFHLLKKFIDRDFLNVTLINVICSVPQKQNEMNCEDIDCEEMNFKPSDRTCLKLQNSDIVKDLDKTLSHLGENQRDELKIVSFECENLFPDLPQELVKSIMMSMSRVQNQ